MLKGVFITGTNTGVGKTTVSFLLLKALKKKRSYQASYFKPIQTGLRTAPGDDQVLLKWDPELSVYSFYSFQEPAAPRWAAFLEKKTIHLESLLNYFESIRSLSATWIVEGAGGLLVPLNQQETNRDLIQKLHLSTIIVASTAIGTLNHLFLTLEASKKSHPILGIFLVGADPDGRLQTMIAEWTDIPILAVIPWISCIDKHSLETFSSEIFSDSLLTKMGF